MIRKEIEQAIAELPPDELARFHRWFNKYYSRIIDTRFKQKQHVDELRGSLRGKGLLNALIADKDFEKRF
jgi:hypothetical protein